MLHTGVMQTCLVLRPKTALHSTHRDTIVERGGLIGALKGFRGLQKCCCPFDYLVLLVECYSLSPLLVLLLNGLLADLTGLIKDSNTHFQQETTS